MVKSSLLEVLGVVGLAMAVPLFAVSVQRCRGSAFGSVLGLLAAVVALGVGTALVDVVPMAETVHRLLKVSLVGAAAVLSVGTATRLVRLTSGRWSA